MTQAVETRNYRMGVEPAPRILDVGLRGEAKRALSKGDLPQGLCLRKGERSVPLIYMKRSGFIVAQIDQRWVGRIEFHRTAGDHGFLTDLEVTSNYRNLGIGGALLDAAIGNLRASGIQIAVLEVDPRNIKAILLYQSKGFEKMQEPFWQSWHTMSMMHLVLEVNPKT